MSLDTVKNYISYCPDTGIFIWLKTYSNAKKGQVAGSLHGGYIRIKFKGKNYLAHRLAWWWITGEMPEEIDHINQLKHDNRLLNLRPATRDVNGKNYPMKSNNKSGVNGVSWHKGRQKWQAYISVDGKRKYLGLFESLEDAENTRNKANKEHNYCVNHGVKNACA